MAKFKQVIRISAVTGTVGLAAVLLPDARAAHGDQYAHRPAALVQPSVDWPKSPAGARLDLTQGERA